jgi:hypothetical protein
MLLQTDSLRPIDHAKGRDTWPAISPRPRLTRLRGISAKKVEVLFAHLKRILNATGSDGGPNGARDEFHLAAIVQNLRKLAKLFSGAAALPASRGNTPLINAAVTSSQPAAIVQKPTCSTESTR